MTKKVLNGVVMTAFLLFWIYIAFSVPYTHDDWDWGLEVGLRQWLTGAVNSRFAGNFFVVLMTRSEILKTAIMGGCMFGLAVLLALLSRGGTFLGRYLAGNLLMLSIPLRIWRQTFGWVSGFANFVISAVLLLGWLLLLERVQSPEKEKKACAAILFVYTLILCLFIENLALLLLGLSLLAVIMSAVRRRGMLTALCSLAGAAIGCFLLFFNPLYADLGETGVALGGIRSLSFSMDGGLPAALDAVAYRYAAVLLPELFLLSPSFCVMMAVFPLLCFRRGDRKQLLAILPAVYGLLCRFPEAVPMPMRATGACLCWGVSLFAALASEKGRTRCVAPILLALGSMAPLAAVTEAGERLFFLPFVLFALATLDRAAPLLDRRLPLLVSTAALCLQIGWYGYVYNCVNQSSELRRELLSQTVENAHAEVVLPTEGYAIWWGRNPQADWRADYYRRFYGLPDDLTLIFLPAGSLDCWPEIRDDDWEKRMEYPPYR